MSTDQYPPCGDPNHIDETGEPLEQCGQTGFTRAFWGLMGLSYVCTGFAIYGTWSGKVSPMLTWPMLIASVVLIAVARPLLRGR